jgi:hypothetical protein
LLPPHFSKGELQQGQTAGPTLDVIEQHALQAWFKGDREFFRWLDDRSLKLGPDHWT